MTNYYNSPIVAQTIIRKAYDFEVEAIRTDSTEPNPWKAKVLALEDGEAIWEAINEALEMAHI